MSQIMQKRQHATYISLQKVQWNIFSWQPGCSFSLSQLIAQSTNRFDFMWLILCMPEAIVYIKVGLLGVHCEFECIFNACKIRMKVHFYIAAEPTQYCACWKPLYCLKYCWGKRKPCSSTNSVILLRLLCFSTLLSCGLIRFCQHDKNIFIIFQDCRAFSRLYLEFSIFVPWTQAQSKSLLFF